LTFGPRQDPSASFVGLIVTAVNEPDLRAAPDPMGLHSKEYDKHENGYVASKDNEPEHGDRRALSNARQACKALREGHVHVSGRRPSPT
jgi:hypothetical protein